MHSVLIGFCESFPTINSHFNCCPPPLCISSLSSAYSHQISLHGATLTTQVKDIQSSLYIMQNQLQNIAPSAPHVSNGNPPTPPHPFQTKCKTCFGGPKMILYGFWKKKTFLLKKPSCPMIMIPLSIPVMIVSGANSKYLCKPCFEVWPFVSVQSYLCYVKPPTPPQTKFCHNLTDPPFPL